MSVSAMYALSELTVAASVAILVVALMRRPLRRIGGAQVAYWLWLLVPASQIAVLLPAPSRPLEIDFQGFPQLVLSAIPAGTSSENYVGAIVDYAMIALVVWASGSLLMLAFMLHGQRVFTRSLGNTTPVCDGTYRSSAVSGPVLVGVWRPRVILPADFESLYGSEERALVLAHERAHLRRGDILINAIATIWLCLSWFNPLMHWAIGRLRFDQELACDAVVLAESGTRRWYAGALLKAQLAADSAWRLPIGCHWQSNHPLKERIAMLKRPLPTFARRLSGGALTCALVLSASYAVWTTQPAPAYAQPDPQQEENPLTISADRVSALVNGDVDFLGNVIIKLAGTDGPPTSMYSDTMTRRDDGSTVVEGAVRMLFGGGGVLTTDRAVFWEDGTIRMDAARISWTNER
jgi:bla regulator protein blaR1